MKAKSKSPTSALRHQISYVPLDDIKPYERNPRVHSKRQIKLLRQSMNEFGVNTPILIDADNRIIAGHGRYEAAQANGLREVPVIRLAHLSETAKRAYMLADNKLAELSCWDQESLGLEFKDLLTIDADIDLSITGFDTVDIDFAIQASEKNKNNDAEDELPAPSEQAISKIGDCWLLGRHRLLCGDARDTAAYTNLLNGEKARLIVTDPPYNTPIAGNVSGLGKVKHDDFVMACGEMSRGEFISFLEIALRNMSDSLVDGGLLFAFMDGKHLYELLEAGHTIFPELKTLITWVKRNAGMGSFYRSQTEFVTVWKQGKASHCNNFGLGGRRYRTNVWNYDGANSFSAERNAELALHPTVKPVAMIADAILDCSNRNDIVLDPFVGSGTIFMAAEKTGRRAYGMEFDPKYVDIAVKRWEQLTGCKATLEADGGAHEEI